MPVSRDKQQIVLQRKRSYPQIVIRNGSAGAFELNEKLRVMFDSFNPRK